MQTRSTRSDRSAARVVALTLFLVVAFALLATPSALAISRDSVLARAQGWVDAPVPYSQSHYHAGYRTDCSGYVSMCWATKTSWSTRSFSAVTRRIAVSQLRPGDALLKKGYHVRLFYGWVDEAHTTYLAYEAGSVVAVSRAHSIAADLAAGYVPTRYRRIADAPAPANVLRNSGFDVWAQSWSGQGQLLWWQVTGGPIPPLVSHEKFAYHSPRSSLRLVNPNSSARTQAQLSQAASVTPGGVYRLSAWALTAFPAKIDASVAYLDLNGSLIAETRVNGVSAALDAAAFREMSAMATAPAGAATAVVKVLLAGGTTTDASGTVLAGTSAIVDDVALTQQRVTSSISANSATSRIGRKVRLSGSVVPTIAVGQSVVAYVQRPGSGWKRLGPVPVSASADSAVWGCSYTLRRGMRRGVYRFRVVVPGVGGYLGSTSGTVSVRVR